MKDGLARLSTRVGLNLGQDTSNYPLLCHVTRLLKNLLTRIGLLCLVTYHWLLKFKHALLSYRARMCVCVCVCVCEGVGEKHQSIASPLTCFSPYSKVKASSSWATRGAMCHCRNLIPRPYQQLTIAGK